MTSKQYEKLVKRYGKQIQGIAYAIKTALEEAAYSCSEVYEDNGNGFSCGQAVYINGTSRNPAETDIDIAVRMIDGEEYDGLKNAVNFKLDIVEYGGRIIGQVCPYNYTDKVWVQANGRIAVEKHLFFSRGVAIPSVLSTSSKIIWL